MAINEVHERAALGVQRTGGGAGAAGGQAARTGGPARGRFRAARDVRGSRGPLQVMWAKLRHQDRPLRGGGPSVRRRSRRCLHEIDADATPVGGGAGHRAGTKMRRACVGELACSGRGAAPCRVEGELCRQSGGAAHTSSVHSGVGAEMKVAWGVGA